MLRLYVIILTRWNLTYVMIITIWDKRKVLNAMTTTCLKDGKRISLIMSKEWDLINIFLDDLLAF